MKENTYVHIASASLVLLSFLLGSPIFLSYLFIYFFLVVFTKPITVGSHPQWEIIYLHIAANRTQRKLNTAVNRLSIGEAG